MNIKIQQGVDQLFNDKVVDNNDSLVEFLIKVKRVNKQMLGIWLSENNNHEILML